MLPAEHRLAGVQRPECAQQIWPHPYSHQITIMIMIMQINSEKSMGHYKLPSRTWALRGQQDCQFQLTKFSVLMLFICLPGNWSFCMKTLRQSKKIIGGGDHFPQRPSGYRTDRRPENNIIMAYHCPLSPRLKIAFLVAFSPWWICAWTSFCCLREQRPFWGPSQGRLVSHHTPVPTW